MRIIAPIYGNSRLGQVSSRPDRAGGLQCRDVPPIPGWPLGTDRCLPTPGIVHRDFCVIVEVSKICIAATFSWTVPHPQVRQRLGEAAHDCTALTASRHSGRARITSGRDRARACRCASVLCAVQKTYATPIPRNFRIISSSGFSIRCHSGAASAVYVFLSVTRN